MKPKQNRSFEKTVQTYLRLLRSAPNVQEELLWSAETVNGWIRDDPTLAWRATSRLIDLALDERDLMLIGTGPLEQLLVDHHDSCGGEVARTSQVNEKMRTALKYADISDLPEWLRNRLDLRE